MVEDPGQKAIFNAERSRAGRERVSERKILKVEQAAY
jgi:hypothetical protein